jgi:anaphase-promoting complex subunit 6
MYRTDWEATWVNLGHALRKLRRFPDAIAAYHRALGLRPNSPSTYAALGYALHLAGDTPAAVEHYHKALGLRPEDGLVAGLLGAALVEEAEAFGEELKEREEAEGGVGM